MVDIPDIMGSLPGLASHSDKEVSECKAIWTQFRDHIRSKPDMTRLVYGRVLAEVAAITGAAVVAGVVSETMLRHLYETGVRSLSRNIVEPNLEAIDGLLKNAKSIDPPEDRVERKQKPKAEQAYQISDYFAGNFGIKGAGAMIGQFAAQEALFKAFKVKVPTQGNMLSVVGDRAVGLGSMITFNTALSKQAVGMQKSLESVLIKTGVSQEKAEKWANYSVNMQLPNIIGLAASLVILRTLTR